MNRYSKTVLLAAAVAMVAVLPVSAQETKTSNGTWNYNGYDYELWSENNAGTTTMILNGDNGTGANAKGGTFSATWKNTINILFRAGRKFSTTTGGTISGREPPKPALDYGNISVEFAATWSSSDNVKMLGIYGWAFYAQGSIPTKDENGSNKTFSKEIEYYIIQDRGSYNAAMGGDTKSTLKGEATIDGIAYEFRVCDRIGRNALSGSTVNFKQYFSVPKSTSSHRTSGTISVSKHFQEWAKVGMVMDGPLYEVAMKVESYTGSGGNANGSATITKNLLTIGATTPAGNYTLDVAASPAAGGTVTKSPNAAYYASGTSVNVTATPTSGYKFDGWSGDADGTTNPLSVTMNKNKTITAKFSRIPDATTNLVTNGTFTSTSNWTLNTWQNSKGTFAVSGGKANITGITLPSGEGAAIHSLQLVQNGIELTQGTKYRVSFDASAASARSIGLMIQKDVEPYTGYYSEDPINLTVATQTFTYDFTMTEATDDNARIAFNLGNAIPNVTISNVKIGYAIGDPTGITAPRPVSTAANRGVGLKATVSNSALNVNFNAQSGGKAAVKLFSLKGDLISSVSLNTVAGNSYSHTFGVAKLPKGIYMVSVSGNGFAEQARVTVGR
jgi:uncharacterized repeat protein (TIGR02543 family)